MKRLISFVTVLVICLSLACPAFATTVVIDVAPSINAKGAPSATFSFRDANGELVDITSCVVVSSVLDAKNKTTDITQEERDLLLDLYDDLSDGSMTVPVKAGYAIRDLIDVSFKFEACREVADHNRKDLQLKEEGVVLVADFELGVAAGTQVAVQTYIDGEWKDIESVEVLANGVVRCVFEDICPVVFAVKASADAANPDTGDTAGNNMMLYVGIMAACAAGLVALVVLRRKNAK